MHKSAMSVSTEFAPPSPVRARPRGRTERNCGGESPAPRAGSRGSTPRAWGSAPTDTRHRFSREAPRWGRPRRVPSPWGGAAAPRPRVTVTLPLLNAAARVLFVVRGEKKAEALREAVAATRDPSRRTVLLPATMVAPRRGTVVFLVDSAAAKLLPPEWRSAG